MTDKTDSKEREAIARAMWSLMREHEDRCDEELEDLEPSHPIWAYADAARASLAANAGSEPVAAIHWPIGGPPRLMWHSNAALHAAIRKAHEGHQSDVPLYDHPSPPEGMVGGWQDIATAPKDGTYLLLWEQYSTNPFVGCWAFGSWSVSHEHVDAEGGWDGANVVDSISQDLITHWMPLPPPPTSFADSRKGE